MTTTTTMAAAGADPRSAIAPITCDTTGTREKALASLLEQIMDSYSVSDDEKPLADAVEAFLRSKPHLTVHRHGDTVVASTSLGRPRRVVLAGHLDTVPVIDNFPPRWLVAQNTFRPPWFHRNIASEFMGLIHGAYDAKAEGFVPGGASMHNCMTGHGPDAATFDKASHAALSKPDVITDTMAFMFETRFPQKVTAYAANSPQRQHDYADCWRGLAKRFQPGTP